MAFSTQRGKQETLDLIDKALAKYDNDSKIDKAFEKYNEGIQKSIDEFSTNIGNGISQLIRTGFEGGVNGVVKNMAKAGRDIWETESYAKKNEYIIKAKEMFGSTNIETAIGLMNADAVVYAYNQAKLNPQQAIVSVSTFDPNKQGLYEFIKNVFEPHATQLIRVIASTAADSIRAIQGSVESVAAATHSLATSVVETAHQSLSSNNLAYGKSLNATQSSADYGYASFPFAMTDTAIQQAMEDKYNAGERSMVDKFAENLVSWSQGPHLRGTASDRMANISVGQGSSITKPFVYTPMQSWYGTMATGPLGPSVFSYNGHDVNFNTDVFYASQGTQSMLLPLGDVGYDFSRYAAGLPKPTSYKTPDNRRDLRPTDISSKKNIFPGAGNTRM
jgi:hypothetical protein